MRKRTLGRTGLQVTQLGYGSMGLRGPRTWGVRVVSDAEADRFLNEVLDSGINFIDTAPDYGVAEERIGRALSKRRDEFYLATKCGCDPVQHDDQLEIRHTWTAEVIKNNLEQSLRNLQTDHIDLMQFHGGDAHTLVEAGLVDLLRDFQQQGRIRFFGVSTSLPELPALIELDVFDTFQIPYSCLNRAHHDLITQAAATGAGIIIRGGIAHGGPDAEIQRDKLNAIWNTAGLDELLTEGMNRAELILRYTISHPHCDTTIVGTCNPAHLAENQQAVEKGPLPESLYNEITSRVKQTGQ
ncbi:aldo/keto reductase [Rubinisphaera margarita]|uniref:aldo/keto reductase n=1 Tax=Rubinisphaera margarita TaxID=2909586 RepID=UPI001EE94994|nr:aldo/keto reductase [Rubinisphaera margarita]MCG6156491.1 aldo/keto reductase [Rubinisphaera margarita]